MDKDIPVQKGREVIDAAGKIAVPGLIDLHCHVYDSFTKNAVPPDIARVRQGVTAVVDGGSAGEATFGGFPSYILPASITTIYCFIYIGSLGVNLKSEPTSWDDIKSEAIADTVERNNGLIKGIKILSKGEFMASHGIEVVKIAKK